MSSDVVFPGKYGLLFYNSVLMFVPALLLAHSTGELEAGLTFAGWHDPWFCVQFALSSIFGFILVGPS